MIALASRQIKVHEVNYMNYDLELGVVLFSLKIWSYYFYGTKCTIFTDQKTLWHIFDKKEFKMIQRRWVKLLNDYGCENRYHNVVAYAFSCKEHVKPQ